MQKQECASTSLDTYSGVMLGKHRRVVARNFLCPISVIGVVFRPFGTLRGLATAMLRYNFATVAQSLRYGSVQPCLTSILTFNANYNE
eukprot:1141962-Pelagomonas_calceolata.AAC.7